MDLKDLSSNWKKLQETLKNETSKPSKRKVSLDSLDSYRTHLKRRRTLSASRSTTLTSTGTGKPEKMGFGSTRVALSGPSASLALWAEDNDVSPEDLAAAYGTSTKSTSTPTADQGEEKLNEGLSSVTEAGKYIALDCEMVGVGSTPEKDSALARVSVVDYDGRQLYDSFVRPLEKITDYRTFVSGITPQLLRSARSLAAVQADVAKLLDGRILVGHSIRKDLDVLFLAHPKRDIRDTSRYPGFRQLAAGKTPSLKKLAREVLGVEIQNGEHSSVEDARATMLLFRKEKEGFEREHAKIWGIGKKLGGNGQTGASSASKNKEKKEAKKMKKKKKKAKK